MAATTIVAACGSAANKVEPIKAPQRPVKKQVTIKTDVTSLAANEARVYQKDLMSTENVDVSEIVVTRLSIQGKQIDVSSIAPVIFQRVDSDNLLAPTVFRFSSDKKTFIMSKEKKKYSKPSVTKVKIDNGFQW